MGRRRTMSIGLLSLLGLVSVTVAGTFGHGDYSYLTSESNHYSPVNSYYLQQPSYQHEPHTPSAPASSVPANPQAPVVRKNRGIGHTTTTTYISASPIYVKSPLSYYPEAHVFSDPLPIVSLPQLPTQFLTLSAPQVSSDSTGTKKARKGRRGKSSVTTPAPVEEEEEDETQETEGDSPASQGGYSSPNQQGGSQQSTEGATGGYPGGNQQQEKPSGATEGATGGYPSNLNANARESQGRTRSRSRSRSNRNRSEEENVSLPEETEADEEEEVADSVEDDSELSNDAEAVPESDSAPEVEVMMMRGRSKGGRSSGKKSRRGKGRAEEEAAVILADGYKIPSIFVPTFGNNVLNTVYPAYSQNTLLKSLQSEVALLNQGYPESDSDIDTVSLVAERKKTRKSKKRTSARKNRPGNRGRSSSGRSRASSARSQEPNQEQNQGGYSNPQEQQQSQGGQNGQSQQYGPPPPQSSGSQNGQSQQYGPPPQQSSGNQNGQSQQYGPPQFTPGTPTNQYGPPSSQQNSGISPPPQQGGGYQTINNELRGRTSDLPRQAQVPALIEPRQVSQSTVISSGDSPLPRADPNDPATAELIRTVQAILQRYPN